MKTSLFAIMVFSASAQAADNAYVSVSTTLTLPPCEVCTGNNLAAEFGHVHIYQIAMTGTASVPVRLVCAIGSSLSVSFAVSNCTHSATLAKTNIENIALSLSQAPDNPAVNPAGNAKIYNNPISNVNISLSWCRLQTGRKI